MGDDDQISFLSRVRPKFATVPATASMTNYYRDQLGAALTADATANISNGKFDVLRSSRWHRASFSFTGDMEIIGNAVTLESDSDE
jgi:aminopeptidase-like protein